SGVLVKIVKGDGGTVVAKEIIATIDTEGKPTAAASAAPSAPPPAAQPVAKSATPAVMPAAQKIAADNNIDAGALSGSGRGGRVTKGDVLDAMQAPAQAKAPTAPAVQARPAAPPVDLGNL